MIDEKALRAESSWDEREKRLNIIGGAILEALRSGYPEDLAAHVEDILAEHGYSITRDDA